MKSSEIGQKQFIKDLVRHNPDQDFSRADTKLLMRAYLFGETKHKGQQRANGNSYFHDHCVPVALKVARLGLGAEIIAAGLLHDTIEDTDATYQELEKDFGKVVADIVEGTSKLSKVKYQGNDRHSESLRKFFLSIAKDINVVIVKLCDRWHNLETLEHLSEEKRQRIARESIQIHAQLASRLGMGELYATLNNLAFPFAYPAEYKKTLAVMNQQLKYEQEAISKVQKSLKGLVTPIVGYQPLIDKRVKGIYSLYKKLEKKKWNISEVYDLIAFRLIVKKVPDCYVALGAIHSHFRPVPGRVKDYIALPKPNGYKSLHTAVFSGIGPIVEIQIRTESMHRFNEYGIASHHYYKIAQHDNLAPQSVDWLKELSSFQDTAAIGSEYLESLTENFFSDRIFVLTPKGDVVDLPVGSTLLDFAYKIHSEIGEKAVSGRVDGKEMPLKTRLASEQIADIITGDPKEDYATRLSWVNNSHSKNIIKKHHNE